MTFMAAMPILIKTFTNLLPSNICIDCLEIGYLALGPGVLPRLFK